MARKSKRQKAILRRNLFLGAVSVVLIAAVALTVFIVTSVMGGDNDNNNSDNQSSSQNQSSQVESEIEQSQEQTSSEPKPQKVTLGDFEGDATYERMLLVNVKNPLPEDHNYKENLMVFPSEYKWFSQDEVYRKLDKDMWPYLKAMMDACRAEIGEKEIGIISAWRDYGTQKTLFDAQVKKWKDKGYSDENAYKEAASRVAIPGTSEHHTGLAVDFNSTNESFENTKAFKWLKENAEDYGFIMRYAKDKMDITGGIIYEPWHWRFVGINAAKEINAKGYCLEEYLEEKN